MDSFPIYTEPPQREAIEQTEQEPVLYQFRTRANWEGALGWSAWENCTKAHAQDYLNRPLVHDWLYEVRALYENPQPSPEWVGFKDVADIRKLANSLKDDFSWIEFAEAIETELKARNKCQTYQKP
jgi:hypothetical protein